MHLRGGRSEPWQMWFQSPASPVMEKILDLHDILFILQAFIVVFVLGVMAVIIVRFNAKSNPPPRRFSRASWKLTASSPTA